MIHIYILTGSRDALVASSSPFEIIMTFFSFHNNLFLVQMLLSRWMLPTHTRFRHILQRSSKGILGNLKLFSELV